MFSFNSPLGACESCRGFGRTIDIDLDLVAPDPTCPSRTARLSRGGSKPRNGNGGNCWSFCQKRKISITAPWQELTLSSKRSSSLTVMAITTACAGGFAGWKGRPTRCTCACFLARYRGYFPCDTCKGARLKPDALLYQYWWKNVGGTEPNQCRRVLRLLS